MTATKARKDISALVMDESKKLNVRHRKQPLTLQHNVRAAALPPQPAGIKPFEYGTECITPAHATRFVAADRDRPMAEPQPVVADVNADHAPLEAAQQLVILASSWPTVSDSGRG